eukprot:gene12924-7434_t
MISNPFLVDDEELEVKSLQAKTPEKKFSNIFLELEEDIDTSQKTSSPSKRNSNIEICDSLKEQSYCTDKKCSENGKHPTRVIICRNLFNKGHCSYKKCRFQHPNPKYVNFLKKSIGNLATQNFNQKLKIQEALKTGQFFLEFHHSMKSTTCQYNDNCRDVKCRYQHIFDIQTEKYSSEDQIPTSGLAIIKPAKKSDVDWITKEWSERSTSKQHKIVKIEEIENKYLMKRFLKRSNEIGHSDYIYAYHGTAKANITTIANSGFLKKFQMNNAYGVGTYFAMDPDVSISYSKGDKQMFFCQLCLGTKNGTQDHIWANGANYYIVPETSGCIPIFIITFQ